MSKRPKQTNFVYAKYITAYPLMKKHRQARLMRACLCFLHFASTFSRERGIRAPGTLASTSDFKSDPFDYSGSSLWPSFSAWAHMQRGRDSNSRYGCPYTHFPGVLLQPLGHLSKNEISKGWFANFRQRARDFPPTVSPPESWQI